jgi:hypothetical protein
MPITVLCSESPFFRKATRLSSAANVFLVAVTAAWSDRRGGARGGQTMFGNTGNGATALGALGDLAVLQTDQVTLCIIAVESEKKSINGVRVQEITHSTWRYGDRLWLKHLASQPA